MNQKNSAEQKGKGLLCKDTFDAPSTTTTAYYKPRAEFLVFPSNVNRNGGPAFKVQGPYAYHMYFAHVFCIGYYKYSIDYIRRQEQLRTFGSREASKLKLKILKVKEFLQRLKSSRFYGEKCFVS